MHNKYNYGFWLSVLCRGVFVAQQPVGGLIFLYLGESPNGLQKTVVRVVIIAH